MLWQLFESVGEVVHSQRKRYLLLSCTVIEIDGIFTPSALCQNEKQSLVSQEDDIVVQLPVMLQS